MLNAHLLPESFLLELDMELIERDRGHLRSRGVLWPQQPTVSASLSGVSVRSSSSPAV